MRVIETDRLRSEINVTPLVDVVLVLLIIFMVVTPLLKNGPPLELPKAPRPERKPATSNELPISLVFDSPPQILFGGDFRRLTPHDFQLAVRAAHDKSPDRPIVLRADRRLTYGDVKVVLSALRAAGFQNVGLIAEREAPE